jgi:hypothetical protein
MATTTTNFGWDIPQSTDLVKDGATAIAALGQDIDTALIDLKGGTTGQVLAKASNTDLDFSWVVQDDTNAIQNALVDAKGDLIGATADNTPARIPIGANGMVLTADSSETLGLKWATASGSGGMVLLSTTTLSGSLTTVSSINQTYQDLYVLVTGMTNATANGSFRVEANGATNNSTSTGAFANAVPGAAFTMHNDRTSRYVGNNSGLLRTNADNSLMLTIFDYASTTAPKPFQTIVTGVDGNSANYIQQGQGGINTNSAITSIAFSNAGGNWSTGTVRIYGVK